MPVPSVVTPASHSRRTTSRGAGHAACRITRVDCAGDEGGIVCHLARDGGDENGKLVVASITHLAFDPRLPLAREIAAYQKLRIKRLRHAQR
jgi:hypothetical protein